MITYRYKFAAFSASFLTDAIASMEADGSGIAIASAPGGIFIDISVPDDFDITKLDSVVSYPYLWTRIGVVTTPNQRAAWSRVKRAASLSVDTASQLPWDAYSALGVQTAIEIVSGDLVPRISGIMRVDCRIEVAPLALMTSLTMRVIRNPGVSQVIIHESVEGPTVVRCNVQFAVAADMPVRIEIEKIGGVGSATLELSETRTYCCSNVIAL